jgi:hypothetical protein
MHLCIPYVRPPSTHPEAHAHKHPPITLQSNLKADPKDKYMYDKVLRDFFAYALDYRSTGVLDSDTLAESSIGSSVLFTLATNRALA